MGAEQGLREGATWFVARVRAAAEGGDRGRGGAGWSRAPVGVSREARHRLWEEDGDTTSFLRWKFRDHLVPKVRARRGDSNPSPDPDLPAGSGGSTARETNLQAVSVLGGVDGGVSLVRLVPVAWSGAAPL